MAGTGKNYSKPYKNMPGAFVHSRVLFNSDGSPADYIILTVNQAFATMAGVPQNKLAGKSIQALKSRTADGGLDWETLYEALAEADDPVQALGFYNPKTNRYFEITTWSDRPGFVAAIYLDVTERKNNEEQLRDNGIRFEALAAAMETGLVVEDSNRNIIFTNQAFCDLFAISAQPETLIGTNCSDAAEQTKNLLADPELFPRRIKEIISKRNPVVDEEIHFADGKIYKRDYIPVFTDDQYFVGHMWQYRDITSSKAAEAELRRKEELYRAVVETQKELICRFKPDTTLIFANKAYLDYFNITVEDIGHKKYLDLVPEKEHRAIRAYIQKLMVNKKPSTYEHEVISGDKGNRAWQRWTDYPLLDGTGKVVEFQSHGYDITEVKDALLKLEASEARLNTLIDKTPAVIYSYSVLDGKPKLNYINKNVSNVLGFKPSVFIEDIDFWYKCMHPDDLPRLANKLKGHESYDEYRFKDSEGHYHWLADQQRPVKNENGQLEIIGAWWDITERKEAEDELRYMSLHDSLTGLYNRYFFEGELRRYAVAREYPIAIISADFDGLKLINDTLGHSAGDSYLIAGAKVLNSALRSSDILARVGGDEFALLLPRTSREDGEKLVARIRQRINTYNQTTEGLPLSISIGLAVCENSKTSLEATFRSADGAMFQDKFERSKNARSAIINFLMASLCDRDQAAKEVAEQVEKLSVRVGQTLNLNESLLSKLELLARVRDLGIITLSGQLLQKSGPLTEKETELIRQHAEIGYRIFSSSPDPELAGVADLVLKHHENFDGTGYPLGLQGEDIPIECRIVAVCAAYCTMINPRPNARILTPEEACAELQSCSGTQFDPVVVKIFIDILTNDSTATR